MDHQKTRLKRLSVLKGYLNMIRMKYVCMFIDKTCIGIKETWRVLFRWYQKCNVITNDFNWFFEKWWDLFILAQYLKVCMTWFWYNMYWCFNILDDNEWFCLGNRTCKDVHRLAWTCTVLERIYDMVLIKHLLVF